MIATLPDRLLEVFERSVTTEYVTVDHRGQPIVWPVALLPPRGPDDRRHHGSRLPQEGRRRRGQPARRPAVLRPDGERPRRPADGARAGHRHGRRPRPRRQPRPLRARVGRQAAGDARRQPPGRCARCSTGTRRGSTCGCVPSACTRGPRRIPSASPSCSTRTSRRSAPGTTRSRRRATRRPRAAAPCGTSAWRSSAATTRPRRSRSSAPTASPSPCAWRCARSAPRGVHLQADPVGAPLEPGLAPHRPCPRARLHVAAQLPGARRPRPHGRRLGTRPASRRRRLRAAAGRRASAPRRQRPQGHRLRARTGTAQRRGQGPRGRLMPPRPGRGGRRRAASPSRSQARPARSASRSSRPWRQRPASCA